ncbi:metalloendopeptidase OMA1, mitochondrial [Patella vulgata]|uniref:metalloendopeptidase OMA1, mitochondrial n=1 Tax=Patella vulgata TaxID=6465 RepID=UPI0021801BF3|nr:metalloendopeptidase OMA1, mitochondrial [Patella vulgata]XP_050402093.1 metalloendopeptidase OMA1, mitochondrial [Patella vulgata]
MHGSRITRTLCSSCLRRQSTIKKSYDTANVKTLQLLYGYNQPGYSAQSFFSFLQITNGRNISTSSRLVPTFQTVFKPAIYHPSFNLKYRQPWKISNLSAYRSFHTSPRRNVPPFLWLFIKPIAKVGAILTGRSTRKWWKSQTRDRKFFILGKALERWHFILFGGISCIITAVIYYRIHQEVSPITGRQRFIAFTPSQFLKIVQAEADMYTEQYNDKLLPADHRLVEYVKNITMRLVHGNKELKEMSNQQWTIAVVDDVTTKNAFVLPTGHIFVFTGILNVADNEDQLAIVIGHEMSHALLSHAAEQLSFAQLIDIFVIAVMAAIWTIMPTDGLAVVTQWFYNKCIQLMLTMPYSRKLEQEADKVGLRLAAKACFDVREGSVFWTKMKLAETGEQTSMPEWLSTHPLSDKRIEHLNFLMADAIALREEAKCPRLKSNDPRETIKVMSKMVDDFNLARKTRQNLRQVHHAQPQDRAI